MGIFAFSAEDHYPDLDRGRKINFWSFSSVNLNVEHVTLPPHVASLTPTLPSVLHLLPQPKMKGRAEKESGREGEKKGRKPRGKDSLVTDRVEGPILYFQLGYVTTASVYQNAIQSSEESTKGSEFCWYPD